MYKWLCALCLVLVACSDGEERDSHFPDLVSEMVVVEANDGGALCAITTDGGARYALANPQNGYTPRAVYRAMASFAVVGTGLAQLYELAPAAVLRDSTATVCHDPVAVVAAWRGARFINLHLSPKTRDERPHYWGFALDSVVGHIHHVSLHHCQNGDPMAYSTTVYASLPIDSIKAATDGDTIAVAVHTPTTVCRWLFAY